MHAAAGIGSAAGGGGVWGPGLRFHHVFKGHIHGDFEFATVQIGYGHFL